MATDGVVVGGDLLDMSRLEGIFGKDLEFNGDAPSGAPAALGSAGAADDIELPGEAGFDPELSTDPEDWIVYGCWDRVGVIVVCEIGDGVESSLCPRTTDVSGTSCNWLVATRV